MSRNDELVRLRTKCYQALSCLFIDMSEPVARDVNEKVKNYINVLEERIKELESR